MGHHLSEAQYQSQVNAVWRATLWLTIITIVEVAAAYVYPESGPRMLLNSFFIGASLLKAYFIVAEFMHVRYETRALALTILVPTLFLVWFIIAFMWEGAEWLNNKVLWDVMMAEPPSGGHH